MVVVVGSSNIDLVVTVDRLPGPGETVPGHHFARSFGGKGANQAVAAKRAGAEVVFLSKLGDDAHGALLEEHLIAEGFSRQTLLRDRHAPTGLAVVLVDRAGRNQIVVVPGSNGALTPDDVRRQSGVMAGALVLLVQLEIPLETVQETLLCAKRQGLTTILNPAPAVPLSTELLQLVDILTPNETEARILTGLSDPAQAARWLVDRGVRTVVVTCGAEGALVGTDHGVSAVPAFLVEAVDTTGAGDAFNGALACALAQDLPIEVGLEVAAAAGALASTVQGAQEAMPLRSAIEGLRGSGTRRCPAR
ncbi:MAG: Bifunctional ribokinase/ribose-5-phosphate isomerase A [Nitrospirae bacterium]|nr:Bifunctional ribokinase/ribose-5-phosphate isomerase A [Nitrospirota bacterium]QOJ35241.1 MAG: ribokinase [Nitrospira sp.]